MIKNRQIVYDAGMDDFLTKPMSFSEIYTIIDKYANKSSSLINNCVENFSLNLINVKDELKVFDKEDLMILLGENEGLCCELIEEFFKKSPKELMGIEKSINEMDREKLKKIASEIKGQLLNMRFNKAGEIFKRLEKQSFELDFESLEIIFSSGRIAINEIKDLLKINI